MSDAYPTDGEIDQQIRNMHRVFPSNPDSVKRLERHGADIMHEGHKRWRWVYDAEEADSYINTLLQVNERAYDIVMAERDAALRAARGLREETHVAEVRLSNFLHETSTLRNILAKTKWLEES